MKQKQVKDEYDIDIQACSTMDCTGLIPSLPRSDAELESYQDLYSNLPVETSVQNKAGKKG